MATGSWWVIPEGFAGKLVNALGPGITLNLFTVTQSATQPNGAVAGPFASQALAQAEATAMNKSGKNQATLPNIASGAAQSAAKTAGQDIFGNTNVGHWILRIGEVLLGIVLIAVGVAHVTKAVPLATKIAKTAGMAAVL